MDVKTFSTENAVFILTVNNFTAIDQQKHIGGICCDVTKAFNCVRHKFFKVNCIIMTHTE